LFSWSREVREDPVGEVILIGASAYCLTGTIIAIALCSAARGSTPPVAAPIDVAAAETAPAAREA
jgi:hypothetical protein